MAEEMLEVAQVSGDAASSDVVRSRRIKPVSGPINIAPVTNVDDGHHTGSVVHPVDHPVGSAARAEPVLQWREQGLAHPVWLFK
jgi:hypothetical protein